MSELAVNPNTIKIDNYIKNILDGLLIVSLIVLISLNLYVLIGTVLIIVPIFLFVYLYLL